MKSTQNLHQQKEYFEALFLNSPVAMISADLSGNVVSWNPAAERLFGYSQHEAIGSNLDKLVGQDESIQEEVGIFTSKIFDSQLVHVKTRRTRKDGFLVDVELRSLPVIIDGEIVGYIAIYHDISDRNRIERELRRQKEYYEALFVNNPVAVVTVERHGNVLSWNPAAEKLFGYTSEEALGQNVDDLVATDESVRAWAISLTNLFTTVKVTESEISDEFGHVKVTTKRTRKDGSLVDVDLLGLPVYVAEEMVGYIVIYHDISEQKRIERELRHQKEYFQALFINSPVAVGTIDNEGKVVSWNRAAEKLFVYTQEEAVGQILDDLVATDISIRAEALAITDQVMNLEHVHATTKRTRKGGSLVDVEVLAVPVIISGETVGHIGLYHDISELQEARREAEAANQAKSDFLARMSHELRTPLNAIIGFTRIVKRKGSDVLPEKQIENLDKVLISADHLLELINDILDLSKIEAGRMDVKPLSFDINPLVDLCLSTTQPLVDLDQVSFKKEIEADISPLYTDQQKLKQILLNLLGNAAKFTPAGKITVNVSCFNDSMVLSVIDTGIGIPNEALERIFEAFQQADTSTTREYGGTGLGLTISHRLANLLGGNLTASSKQGEGSIFTLTIPMNYGNKTRD
jgi:PAS domain S-box-containing protein